MLILGQRLGQLDKSRLLTALSAAGFAVPPADTDGVVAVRLGGG